MRCSNMDGPDVPPPGRPCLVRENGYVYAAGRPFQVSATKPSLASTTAMTFVPGCFEHENDGKGRFAQPASSEFSGGQRPTLRVKVNRERSPPTVSRSMTSRTDLTNQYTDLPQENFEPREAGLNDQPQRSARDARELQRV